LNPNLCQVALRPRGPLEAFDLAFRFARERHGPLGKLLMLTLFPLWLLTIPACLLTDGHLALLLVPIVVGPFVQAPFTVLSGRLLFASQYPIFSVVKDVLTQLPALLTAWAIGVLGWAISSLSCFTFAVLVQGSLLYHTETALLERVGPQRGLRRTFRLAGGNFGIALVGALSRWVLLAFFGLVAEAIGQGVVNFILQLGQPFGSLWSGQVTPFLLGGLLFAQAAHAVYRLFLYLDVRTRVEGWDIQVGLLAARTSR
jgi:hypothetical protein